MKDPVTTERHEIAALLERHAATFEGEARLYEFNRTANKQTARVLRHMVAALGDRPPPDPTLRAFTATERDGLRVLLDQLFESSPTAASALAQQLGLALKVDLPRLPARIVEGERVEFSGSGPSVWEIERVRFHEIRHDLDDRAPYFGGPALDLVIRARRVRG